jgi:hypothetical protein
MLERVGADCAIARHGARAHATIRVCSFSLFMVYL